jgi:hypothetical protein
MLWQMETAVHGLADGVRDLALGIFKGKGPSTEELIDNFGEISLGHIGKVPHVSRLEDGLQGISLESQTGKP